MPYSVPKMEIRSKNPYPYTVRQAIVKRVQCVPHSQ